MKIAAFIALMLWMAFVGRVMVQLDADLAKLEARVGALDGKRVR
jgi:hypothetical protein